MNKSELLPTVSIVVTTKNEESYLRDCLLSIKNQTCPIESLEIIVVDNNSTDKTKSIAKEFTDFVFNLGPERSAQRNFGMSEKARGEYVMYLDADMRLSSNVIGKCLEEIKKDDQLVGLYISEIIICNGFWGRVRKFERSFYDATVIDCVRFMPKKIFQDLSGFDGGLTGPEDWDFDKRLRQIGKTDLVKEPIYHDESDFGFKKYLGKKSYYTPGFVKYIKKWGKSDPDIKKQFGLIYRYFGIFLEEGRWRRIIAHPILSFGMFTLRFLVGVAFLTTKGSKRTI